MLQICESWCNNWFLNLFCDTESVGACGHCGQISHGPAQDTTTSSEPETQIPWSAASRWYVSCLVTSLLWPWFLNQSVCCKICPMILCTSNTSAITLCLTTISFCRLLIRKSDKCAVFMYQILDMLLVIFDENALNCFSFTGTVCHYFTLLLSCKKLLISQNSVLHTLITLPVQNIRHS